VIISAQGWKFEVDLSASMAYSSAVVQEHCQCGYCRNFYVTVDEVYPNLRKFLGQFGVSVEGPEELMPFEPTLYSASYCICGTVLQRGLEPMNVDGVPITVLSQEATDYAPACASPYFVLRTGVLGLPWALEEDMDEVISPANEPEYLQRMWDRLLSSADDISVLS